MRRRAFIAGLGGVAAWPLTPYAQQSNSEALIAWLSTATRASNLRFIDAFLKGLKDLGYSEDRDFKIEYRFAENYNQRLPELAAQVVRAKPSVILATATGPAMAARKATHTIPIVTAALADAVHLGLIASEARPETNVTGISPYIAGLPAKQMELARQLVPSATVIGVLTDLEDPKAPPQWEELDAAGRGIGVKVVAAEARTPDDLNSAMQAVATAKVDMVIVLQTSMLLSEREQIATLAAANQLPTLYGYREHVAAAGLISYGVDLRECFYRAAAFVDKILKRTAPAELPVEFPTKVELVINMKTAKALGLIIPASLLARADEVIE
jgi:ABC-type uncharacterized transport system substrate-binding protein